MAVWKFWEKTEPIKIDFAARNGGVRGKGEYYGSRRDRIVEEKGHGD